MWPLALAILLSWPVPVLSLLESLVIVTSLPLCVRLAALRAWAWFAAASRDELINKAAVVCLCSTPECDSVFRKQSRAGGVEVWLC